MAATRQARALTLGHRDLLLRLRASSANGIGSAWSVLGNLDDDARFIETASGLVTASRETTVNLARSYVASYGALEGSQLDLPPEFSEEVLASVRGGVAIEETYHRPQIVARRMLANGAWWDQAMAAAQRYAIRSIVTDIALTNRAALDRATDLLNPKPKAWMRVAGATACGFCATTAGQLVSRPNIAPLHPNCSCTLEAVFQTNRRVPVPKPKPKDKAEYTIGQHGELGAVPLRIAETLTQE